MRLLVTGGSGYLGSELVARARAAEWDVTGTSSRDFDVRDHRAVEETVARLRPDVIVHTAYRQDGPDFRGINFDGTANVASTALEAGIRLVHVSTDVVFDGRAGRPYVESDTPSPITDYGRSKAAAELAAAGAEGVIVRTSLIYGGTTPSKHELAARDPTNVFFANELRNPIQVGDLAVALLELAATDVTGVLHVAGADDVSRCEFARLIARTEVRCVPAPVTRPLDCRLDSSRARSLLKTCLRGVHEVLGR